MKRPLIGKWYPLIGAIIGAIVVLVALAAQAQDVDLPIDTVYRGDPGDIIPVATVPADPGVHCVAELEGHNNRSIHPDSDILVGPVTFTNVENGTFQAAALTFTTTGPINVMVRLGADGVFSAGFTLEVTCNPPESTTTTQPDTTPTTDASTPPTVTTPPATTTTLSEPPVGGISTGGGACADGACDGWSLSPLQTWTLIGVAWSLLAGLAWAFVHGATRGSDG